MKIRKRNWHATDLGFWLSVDELLRAIGGQFPSA